MAGRWILVLAKTGLRCMKLLAHLERACRIADVRTASFHNHLNCLKMPYLKLLSVLFFLVLTGCVSPGPELRVTLADGRQLIVSMKDGRVVGEENKYVKVSGARFMYNAELKNGTHVFVLEFTAGSIPASIKIEDFSDTKVDLMVQDLKPELKGQLWNHTCPPVSLNDPSMIWMHDIDDGFRIYRVVVVLQDGTEVKLHHVAIYPSFAKIALITAFKAKAP